jgi:hypothetical protein
MAATFTSFVSGTAFAANKSLSTCFNGAASGRVLRTARIICLNNQTAAVTGVLTTIELRRVSASSGGTAATITKHDTASTTLVAQILNTTGATDTLVADIFRRFMWSNDEPSVSSAVNDELECIVPLCEVWNSAINDAAIEHITSRPVEGVSVRHTGSTTVGIVDVIQEFTDAAT